MRIQYSTEMQNIVRELQIGEIRQKTTARQCDRQANPEAIWAGAVIMLLPCDAERHQVHILWLHYERTFARKLPVYS